MHVTWTHLDDPKELPVDWCTARKIWKLKSRFKRLCNRSQHLTGSAWYEVNDHIFQTLTSLSRLGAKTEDLNG